MSQSFVAIADRQRETPPIDCRPLIRYHHRRWHHYQRVTMTPFLTGEVAGNPPTLLVVYANAEPRIASGNNACPCLLMLGRSSVIKSFELSASSSVTRGWK
jgi:hypothetical protein